MAMSQENVEIIKTAIDAFNREDWDAVFQDAAPSAERSHRLSEDPNPAGSRPC
jgi:hypothetical protein